MINAIVYQVYLQFRFTLVHVLLKINCICSINIANLNHRFVEI